MSKYQAYPEYKDSGVEWLGVIPSHWDMVRFKYRLAEKKKTPNPQLEAGAISFGRVLYKSSENLAPETKASYQEVLAGEFLINPLNMNYDLLSLRTALSDIDVVVSTGYIVARSDKQLVKRYVRWLLYQFDVAHMKTLGSGVRQTINFMDIGNSFFYEPTRLEQEKIANFLDHETAKIDTLIDKQQQLIQLLKEKRQAVISHAVTKGLNPNAPMRDSGVEWLGEVPEHWEMTRAKFVSNIFIPQRNKPELNDAEGTAWVTMENMKTSYIENTSLYVSRNASKVAGSKKLKKDSVIASCVGSFGVAAINKVDVIINQQLQAFIPFAIKAEYLRELVAMSTVYFELVGTAATLTYVNQEGFENLPVLVPPANEQKKICIYLEAENMKFENLIDKAQSAIQLMQERRTALISAAVTGKIDVSHWQVPAPVQNKEAV